MCYSNPSTGQRPARMRWCPNIQVRASGDMRMGEIPGEDGTFPSPPEEPGNILSDTLTVGTSPRTALSKWRAFFQVSRLVPALTALMMSLFIPVSTLGWRYGTLVDLDGERCEWVGMLQLSMEIPCAYAA